MMPNRMARVLVIDDNETMRDGMAISIKTMGHDVTACANGADGVAAYQKRRFDFVVTDLKMQGMDGLEVVKHLRGLDAEAVVLIVTAFGSIESAVEAMRAGAFNYIQKPFSPDTLRAQVEKAIEVASLRQEAVQLRAHNEVLRQDAAAPYDVGGIVGQSEAMQKVMAQVKKVAPTDFTVLVLGESGTGKELIARALHELSERKRWPFVDVHCAALAETLLESELFGHEKGSFTGAVRRKLGRFELANGGTLFLDEIGEISTSVQTKLLRVLQEHEIQRVGGEETIKCDVRVIAATNRDLLAEVKAGRFREDLFYRLQVVTLQLPALRERLEDVASLADYFLKKHAPSVNRKVRSFAPAAVRALSRYSWPGNVRELENAIEQALVFGEGETLTEDQLPAFVTQARSAMDALPLPSKEMSLTEILEDLERQLILRAYEKARGVKTETARLLGIKTSALYYKLEKYGIVRGGPDGEGIAAGERESPPGSEGSQ
jgi:two-component system, NtrC family, response regulator HydG